jgi:hypothetical protein
MARSKVRIDTEKQILTKNYRPGQVLAVMSKDIEKRAVRLARTNNGRGWAYDDPENNVRGFSRGITTPNGRYAAGIKYKPGSGARPRMELIATAKHSQYVEFGNGQKDIRPNQSFRNKALAPLLKKARENKKIYEARKAREEYIIDNGKGEAVKNAEDRLRKLEDHYKKWLKDLAIKKNAIRKARFVLNTPNGIVAPDRVRPMGKGKVPSEAEVGGYGTINRAMRTAVKEARRDINRRRRSA